MRISDWRSDVCSSDLDPEGRRYAHDAGLRGIDVDLDFLKAEQMIDARGKVQDKLRQALKEGTLTLPPEYAAHLPQVKEVLRKEIGSTSGKERGCQSV